MMSPGGGGVGERAREGRMERRKWRTINGGNDLEKVRNVINVRKAGRQETDN